MQRRTFLKYSTVTGTAVMYPQSASARDWDDIKRTGKKLVKTAIYCSRLNPVRFVAGLVFDGVKEAYVKPLIKSAFNDFTSGKTVAKSSLSYYDSSSVTGAKTIEYEPYKASVVVYGVADYELYQQEQVRLELTRQFDKERFAQIQQYLKDEKAKLKLYNRDTTFRVGSDLEPNDLFNIDYISYKNATDEPIHIYELLKATDNKAFSNMIA